MRLIAEAGADHEMIGIGGLDGGDADVEISLGDHGSKGVAIGGKCRAAGSARLALASSASFRPPGGIRKNGASMRAHRGELLP